VSLLSENEQKNMLRAKINAQETAEQRLRIQLNSQIERLKKECLDLKSLCGLFS